MRADIRRMTSRASWLASVLLALSASCFSSPGQPSAPRGLAVQPDLAISYPPYDRVQVGWKERIGEAYAFLEARGSYTGIGRLLEQVAALAQEHGLEVNGPPFALYYDDPGSVSVDQLRMRACLPLSGPRDLPAPLQGDLLESTTVVYAFVAGPYPDVPRAYPALFAYLAELGWRENGPIRESYLVNPAGVSDYSELVTEVQIPAVGTR